MQRIILHIDFDSFFASVEQQNNTRLRNRPVGVTATNGRNCIIAASREAKKLGIRSPSRTYDAQKICPSIMFTAAHFIEYWEVSKKFLSICKDFSPYVEVFSIDEVFMDVTRTAALFGGIYPLVAKIKQRLLQEIGPYITASFGISYNKLLAKLASGLQKPNGLVEIRQQDVSSVYQSAKLTDICGIGNRVNARLIQMGILTPYHLRFAPLASLLAEFGDVEGRFLHDVGLAIDNRPVIPYTEKPQVKSVSRNYCLPQNEYDSRRVLQNVYELCEEVALKLRRLEMKARTVGVYLRGKTTMQGRQTFSNYLNSGKELFEGCTSAILQSESRIMKQESGKTVIHNSLFLIPNYVRQIGVWASSLEYAKNISLSLFSDDQRREKLQRTIDGINEKFGDHTIRNGFLLDADKLTTVPNGYLADKYERIKLADAF
jgi:DNA polymerase-4